MSKLLTIAIPTYNRAQIFEKQLAWLALAIKGYESECEVIISDNCSTDNTQEVIKKWKPLFNNTTFISHRNNVNIGLMPNLVYCVQAATSKYVWVVGDDDPIHEISLAYVVSNLKKHPDLGLLILNFSWFDVPNNYLLCERCFSVEKEEIHTDGKAVIENYFKTDFYHGLGFMTAQIYLTSAAKQAIKKWSGSINNLEGQIYWTAFCALQGSVKITKDVYLEYASGMNPMHQPKLWFKITYGDMPTVLTKLIEIGYSEIICRKLILKTFRETNWKVILGALRRWPVLTTKTMVNYLGLVSISASKMLWQLK